MRTSAQIRSASLKAKLFRGFSDASRLSILNALGKGALTVSEIVQVTRLTQSNVSNHLGCLRDCGLVSCTQQGRYMSYQLSDSRVAEVLTLADELLANVAKGIYECTRYNCSKEE